MSTPTANSKPPRRWLQFSMRGVLLFTLGAAILSAWLIAPRERFRALGKTSAKVREEFRRVTDPNTRQAVPILNGRWELFDERGLLRIRGQIDDGALTGRWTYYDETGTMILDGQAYQGLRIGLWTAWHNAGPKQSEARYELAKHVEYERQRSWGAAMGGFGGAIGFSYEMRRWRRWEVPVSVRAGETKVWWPNGKERIVGAYAPNSEPITLAAAAAWIRRGEPPMQETYGNRPGRPSATSLEYREGPWATLDEQGREASAGSYRHGVRDGQWRIAAATGEKPREVTYVAGHEVESPSEQIERLTSELNAPKFRDRHRAMWQLMQLGDLVRPQLLAWLQGDNLERQRMAAGALAQVAPRDPEALEAIVAVAIDAKAPRDLRLSILETLGRQSVKSDAAAKQLSALTSSVEPDLELRNAARLASVALSPATFFDVVEQYLIDFAGPDPRASDTAFTSLNSSVIASEPWGFLVPMSRLDRPTRLALVAALTGRLRSNPDLAAHSPVVQKLMILLKSDEDAVIRDLAAKLSSAAAAQASAVGPGGMSGSWGSFPSNLP